MNKYSTIIKTINGILINRNILSFLDAVDTYITEIKNVKNVGVLN